jgi:hypothetical protein
VPSITPSPREGIEDGPRLRVRSVPIALAEADQRNPGERISGD